MNQATATAATMVIVKHMGYVLAFIAGSQYLGLLPESILVLTLFIIFDIVSGILKTMSLHGGSAIKSSIFERGVLAKLLVICIPLNLALTGKGIGLDLHTIAQGTITVLIFSELYSILGNFYAIRTGQERVEFDAVAALIGKIKLLLKAVIQD